MNSLKHIIKNGIAITHSGLEEGVIREVFDENAYRIETIPAGSKVLDLGANIGCFSLRCAFERCCSVAACEPHPISREFLLWNIKQNNKIRCMTAHISVDGNAVGCEYKNVTFACNPGHPAGSGIRDIEGGIPVPVRVVPLQMFLESNPDVVKMDIEASEREALTDDLVIPESVKYFVMEWHSQDRARWIEYFDKRSFKVEVTSDANAHGGILYANR